MCVCLCVNVWVVMALVVAVVCVKLVCMIVGGIVACSVCDLSCYHV